MLSKTETVSIVSENPNVMGCSDPSAESLNCAIRALIGNGASSILVLAAASDRWDPDSVEPLLNRCPVPIFGGVFPAIIVGDALFDAGTIVVGLDVSPDVMLFKGLSQDREKITELLSEDEFFHKGYGSITALIDSRRANAEFFVDSLYDLLGDNVQTAGGGVGSLTERFVPCLFTNSGLVTDAALLLGFQDKAIQDSDHGWKKLDGPFLISSADGTKLHSLNYQPALTVYREAVERCTNWRFSEQEFRTISSLFPLGIEQPFGPHLVRDPLMTEDDSLVCVGEVPEGAIVQILTGDKEGLVAAARQVSSAVVNERKSQRSPDPALAMIWDCASRRKFLKQNFSEELRAISDQIPSSDYLVGALTLAEVANLGAGTMRLLNKSLVMVYP
ncbi:MAG: FIST signal transduction protein [Geminicoccales bacterium]